MSGSSLLVTKIDSLEQNVMVSFERVFNQVSSLHTHNVIVHFNSSVYRLYTVYTIVTRKVRALLCLYIVIKLTSAL